jgi:hypothetical protein
MIITMCLLEKRVSCKDDSLAESFGVENIHDVENMGNTIEDLCNEELHGEMIYIYLMMVWKDLLGSLGLVP